MAKYAKFQKMAPEKKHANPIWRGIGCILIIVVPLLSYGLMLIFSPLIIATGKVPYQLLGHPHFPEWVFKSQISTMVASYISSINNLWANIIIFLVMALILTTLASLFYSAIYAIVGPARYTELDAPPTKYKPKKYTR